MTSNKLPPPPICIFRGHKGAITALHLTNEIDDTITDKPSLISGSDSGEIFIWSLKTEKTYYRFKGHRGKMILYLCYYNSSLISQGRDGYIHEWKYKEREWNIIRSFNSSSLGFCAAILFCTEAQNYLVTETGEKMSLTFYDYDKSSELKIVENEQSTMQNSSEICMCMNIFMKEGKMYLLMGHDSGFISLWDCESGEEKSRLKCHQEISLCLDYDSKHRNCGISGSADDSLEVWEIDKKEQLAKKCSVKITNPGVHAIKIRSDGKVFITAGLDKSIRVFSWKSLKPLAVLKWHSAPVTCLALNAELNDKYSSVFAAGSKDHNISLFSIY